MVYLFWPLVELREMIVDIIPLKFTFLCSAVSFKHKKYADGKNDQCLNG